MSNADLDGPAQLAATTLLSICLLYDDVNTPLQAVDRAFTTVQRAIVEITAELSRRE